MAAKDIKPYEITKDTFTPEQRREIASKGGKAKAESMKRRKALQEAILAILDIPTRTGKVCKNLKSLEDAGGQNLTVEQTLILAQVKKALKGDTRAFEFLRDTAGMKPVEEHEITAEVSPAQEALSKLMEQIK